MRVQGGFTVVPFWFGRCCRQNIFSILYTRKLLTFQENMFVYRILAALRFALLKKKPEDSRFAKTKAKADVKKWEWKWGEDKEFHVSDGWCAFFLRKVFATVKSATWVWNRRQVQRRAHESRFWKCGFFVGYILKPKMFAWISTSFHFDVWFSYCFLGKNISLSTKKLSAPLWSPFFLGDGDIFHRCRAAQVVQCRGAYLKSPRPRGCFSAV